MFTRREIHERLARTETAVHEAQKRVEAAKDGPIEVFDRASKDLASEMRRAQWLAMGLAIAPES